MQTAIWIPPSLCGCQLKIVAEWATGSIVNGISYKHPKQFSIRDVQIISVCDAHKGVTAPDVSRHFHESPVHGTYQARGYLRHHEKVTHHPCDDPSAAYGHQIAPVIVGELTAAQHLYEFLCQYKGYTQSLLCGCRAHIHEDEGGNQSYKHKPGITQKCKDHLGDSIDMKAAANTLGS